MDLVFHSLLPSVDTRQFKEAVSEIINIPNSKEIIWIELEYLIADYAQKSSTVFKEYPFLVHHVVAKDPPVAVVTAIVDARPESLILLDVYRAPTYQIEATPLGIACRSGASLEVVRYLIRTMLSLRCDTPRYRERYKDFERSRTDGLLTTTGFPLDTSLDVVKVLLQEYPEGSLSIDNLTKETIAASFAMSGVTTEDYFDKLKLILMAGSQGTIKTELSSASESTFLLPHAFLDAVTGRFRQVNSKNERDYFGLDEERIVSVLIFMHKKLSPQFRETDENGDLPLHIALSNRRFLLNTKSRIYGAKIIRSLLSFYPESIIIPDGKGRLPLHIAIRSLVSCYSLIFDASPPWVLETKCPVTGLFPFQIPSTDPHRISGMILWTEMSYILLQKAPMLARGLAANREPWLDSEIFKEIQIAKLRREQESGRIAVLERKLEQLKATGCSD